jgi:lipoprotein Spr
MARLKYKYEAIINFAMRYVGMQFKKYPPPIQIDCSSFTQMVFAKHGIQLPRTAIQQAKQGIKIKKSDLRPGDLLFFYVQDKHPSNDIVGHVGIYAGKQKMVHCIPYSNVFLTSINTPHWKRTFLLARRVFNEHQVMKE